MARNMEGKRSTEKNVPLRNDNGSIIKFVTVDTWSNFSAQSPVIKPREPRIKDPKNVPIKI